MHGDGNQISPAILYLQVQRVLQHGAQTFYSPAIVEHKTSFLSCYCPRCHKSPSWHNLIKFHFVQFTLSLKADKLADREQLQSRKQRTPKAGHSVLVSSSRLQQNKQVAQSSKNFILPDLHFDWEANQFNDREYLQSRNSTVHLGWDTEFYNEFLQQKCLMHCPIYTFIKS